MTPPQRRLQAQQPTASSSTRTVVEETQAGPSIPITRTQGTLVLRGAEREEERRHIQWAEDVVDNEGMGKKSSKGTFYVLREANYGYWEVEG